MFDNKERSSFRNNDFTDNDFENKEDLLEKQHLSDVEMEKLRNVIKTKVAGELIIKLPDLERTLHLAGQNMTRNTIEILKKKLEETYHTDEYFLDEIEHHLAPYWEELTDEEIARLLIESFETFDVDQQGSIDKQDLIKNLTTLGEMPFDKKDFQIIFSLINNPKNSSIQFDYRQFVNKLCGLENNNIKKVKKKKKKTKVRKSNHKKK